MEKEKLLDQGAPLEVLRSSKEDEIGDGNINHVVELFNMIKGTDKTSRSRSSTTQSETSLKEEYSADENTPTWLNP